jgi:hypothetical protein
VKNRVESPRGCPKKLVSGAVAPAFAGCAIAAECNL